MKNNDIPVLAPDKSYAEIGEVRIKLNQNIDYKSATDPRVSIGKVVSFQYAGWRKQDKTSVHMRIVDVQDNNKSEWVSVYRWYCEYQRGIFGKPKEELKNESREPDVAADLPF